MTERGVGNDRGLICQKGGMTSLSLRTYVKQSLEVNKEEILTVAMLPQNDMIFRGKRVLLHSAEVLRILYFEFVSDFGFRASSSNQQPIHNRAG